MIHGNSYYIHDFGKYCFVSSTFDGCVEQYVFSHEFMLNKVLMSQQIIRINNRLRLHHYYSARDPTSPDHVPIFKIPDNYPTI